jgi:trigger factor
VARGAQSGDRITFDVEGELDGRPLEGSAGENRVVEIGAGHVLPDLDRGLVGLEPLSARDIEVRYPDDHPSPLLAGNSAVMHVEVRKVEEGVLPEVDPDFIRGFGVESGDRDDLRRDVRSNLERELEAAAGAVTRNRLLDALLERHPVEVPGALVAEELGRAGLGGPAEAPGDAEREAAEASVRRRLQQGLVLAQIVSDQDLAPDPGAVRAEIERMAVTYEDPAQVVSWFYSDPSRLRPVESRLVEQQAIDAMLAQVKVVDEPSEFDELMNPGQTSEASS